MKSYIPTKFRSILPALAIVFSPLGSVFSETPTPPTEWIAWANWADGLHPIGDKDGHGPDIGSDEWAAALDRQLGITDKAGHGPDRKSNEWRTAAERKLLIEAASKPAKETLPQEKRELLSSHDTEARFLGIQDHRCLGRTARCPDHCGHSGKLARFAILNYISYRKPGDYGDPKQKEFSILITDNKGNPKVPAETLTAIKELKSGDPVRLKWNHYYVTHEGTSFPERVIADVSPQPKPAIPKSE